MSDSEVRKQEEEHLKCEGMEQINRAFENIKKLLLAY